MSQKKLLITVAVEGTWQLLDREARVIGVSKGMGDELAYRKARLVRVGEYVVSAPFDGESSTFEELPLEDDEYVLRRVLRVEEVDEADLVAHESDEDHG